MSEIEKKDHNPRVYDGRKKPKAPNLKHLRFSRELPVKCDTCPYRPKEYGGSGKAECPVYESGSLCKIRKDIREKIDEFNSRNPDVVLPLMREQHESMYETIKFAQTMENLSGYLDPELSKRINSFTNMSKVISDVESKKNTVELEERRTLTADKKQEIAQFIRFQKEGKEDEEGSAD